MCDEAAADMYLCIQKDPSELAGMQLVVVYIYTYTYVYYIYILSVLKIEKHDFVTIVWLYVLYIFMII